MTNVTKLKRKPVSARKDVHRSTESIRVYVRIDQNKWLTDFAKEQMTDKSKIIQTLIDKEINVTKTELYRYMEYLEAKGNAAGMVKSLHAFFKADRGQ